MPAFTNRSDPPVSRPFLSPEFRLLCLAIRRRRSETERRAMAGLIAEGIDWPLLIDGARLHRTTRLALCGLRSCPDLPVPETALDTLRRQAGADARRALAQAGEVVALRRRLADAGVPVIVLKGVVLSQRLYDDVAMRGVGDIDLLVAPETFERATAVLTTAGYLPDSSAVIGAGPRDVGFRHPERKTYVELHQRLTINPSRLENDFSVLWARRGTAPLGGAATATLPAATEPLYLCVHGLHHGWERLCWLADLAVSLEPPAARAAALDEARAAGLERPLRFSLALADSLLREVPPGADGDPETRRFVRNAYGGDRWRETPQAGGAARLRREWRRRWTLYTLKPGWRHLRDEIVADLSNPVDRHLFRLPARLSWLYPFLRPVGWFYRNSIRR